MSCAAPQDGCMKHLSTAVAMLHAVARPERVTILAALTDGSLAPSVIAQRTGLPLRIVGKELIRLENAGLVRLQGSEATLTLELAGEIAERLEEDVPLARYAREHGVERFFQHGRLSAMPVDAAGKHEIARTIVELVPYEQTFTEPEIDQILAQVHWDIPTIRRLLVDEGFVDRDGSTDYRRLPDA